MQLPLEYLRSEVVEGKIVPLMLIAVVCTCILQSDLKSEKKSILQNVLRDDSFKRYNNTKFLILEHRVLSKVLQCFFFGPTMGSI